MSNLQSLSEIYNNKLFRIPDYQRGYAWKQTQLVDFWEDILNLNEDRYHYTGLLSLKTLPKSETRDWECDRWLLDSGYRAYHVVDGQQRLTTFSILINEIIKFVKNQNQNIDEDKIVICDQYLHQIREKYISRNRPKNIITSYLFGYERDNPSAKYLIHKIYEKPHGGEIKETYYTQNLKRAKEFYHECLVDLYKVEGIEGIEKIFYKLTLKLMFNIHEIEDDYDVFVAFETMNNRGKKLTNLELLKNRLIYLTTLYKDSDLDEDDKIKLRELVNDTWKEIYYQIGRDKNRPLSDDEFLRAHWIIYFQYTRQKSNAYIDFLLNKFSSKNIFIRHSPKLNGEIEEIKDDEISDDEDELEENKEDADNIDNAFLDANEIKNYVNSLKDVAEFWFYSHFPDRSELSKEEIRWIEKLNRIGIGHFRPILTVSLLPELKISKEERLEFLKAVERFIFILFRMGRMQSTYKSSYYYRKARLLYRKEITMLEIIKDLNKDIKVNREYVIESFINQIDKNFSNKDGFYAWRGLRYFLYEYENEKAMHADMKKIGWEQFTHTSKNKITIEHILPQTPTKWYWRNQFRQYTSEEIKILSASLGNLLPLSQWINSALQNDSFKDKKTPNGEERRGYYNGSHSEIEVAQQSDWNAKCILERGMKLLRFFERRWGIKFKDEEQMLKLLHVEFVNDQREEIPELEKELIRIDIERDDKKTNDISKLRLDFWENFVRYCNEIGRGKDIASRKPYPQNWYDVSIGKSDYYAFFNIVGDTTLKIGIYISSIETYNRLESKKEEIERTCGFKMEWYASREKSIHKRVLYSKETDVYDKSKYKENFDWMIEHYDKLKRALDIVD